MYKYLATPLLFLLLACNARNQVRYAPAATEQKAGGPCEGCEAIYECPVPFEQLNETDTLPGFDTSHHRLLVTGTVFRADNITPAPDVVIYIYHTGRNGLYTAGPGAKGWEKRHGALRGWAKTNAAGQYRFYTQLPASYPNSQNPMHIHPTIKESGFTEYYIDEFLFDNDPLLTTAERNKLENRGGYGIMTMENKDGLLVAERNIYLGRNIPGYPQPPETGVQSGLDMGDNCPAFEPLHLAGPDAGAHACPACKYGYGRGMMLWLTQPPSDSLTAMVRLYEQYAERRQPAPKLFVIYLQGKNKWKDGKEFLTGWYRQNGFRHTALLWLEGDAAAEAGNLYRIHPDAVNTVLLYSKRKVVHKQVNMEYNTRNFNEFFIRLNKLP